MTSGRSQQPKSDAELESLLRMGAPDCIDEAAIDQGDLVAYATGEALDEESTARVRRHLAECTYCAALGDEYRRIVPEAEVEPEAPAPRERGTRRPHGIRTRILAIAASVLIAVGIGDAVWHRMGPSEPLRAIEVVRVRGRVAATMGHAGPETPTAAGQAGVRTDTDLQEPWRFVSESLVEILATPREEGGAKAPVLGVYLIERGQRALVRVDPSHVQREGDDKYPVFRVRGSGEELFGRAPNVEFLVLAYAESERALAGLSGRTVEEAVGALGPGQVRRYEVRYSPTRRE